MLISLNWIKEFVEIPDLSPKEIGSLFTLATAEVEDVIVKGDDYTEDQVVGGKEVKSWGGQIALIPIVPGRSTSGILEKIAS